MKIYSIIISLVAIIALSGLIYSFNEIRLLSDSSTLNEKELIEQIETQKKAKNEIRAIYETQTANTDKFDRASQKLSTSSRDLLLEIDKSIRFIDGKPQILTTAKEESLKEKQKAVITDAENVSKIGDETEAAKNEVQKKVDAIYVTLNEDGNNRANPDGLR
jgi:hypothetical protein